MEDQKVITEEPSVQEPLPVQSQSKKRADRNLEAEIKELFRTFDKDNDRSISTKELGKAMRFLGLNADQENVKKAMKCLDANGNGRIEYKEFLLFMKKEFERDPQCQDEENHIRAAFRMFDRDGNGYIDRKELKYALTNLGEKMSEKEIKDMMRQADVNGDGKIDYEEFVKIWEESK